MKNKICFGFAFIIILCAFSYSFSSATTNNIPETVSAEGITTMVVSENDLNQFSQEMIDGQLKGFIKSASVKIFDGYVEVTAVAQKPITATIFVRAEINVANNKLYPKILKMRYGFLPIPSFWINFFIGKLVGQNSQNFQSTGVSTPGIEWQSVDFKTGVATVLFKEVKK